MSMIYDGYAIHTGNLIGARELLSSLSQSVPRRPNFWPWILGIVREDFIEIRGFISIYLSESLFYLSDSISDFSTEMYCPPFAVA
jgi:hypothetical protein